MIKNISSKNIIEDAKIKNSFVRASYKDKDLSCNILKGDFYLDTFNYFPITENFETFKELFLRDINKNIDHFYTESFFNNFSNNIKNFKRFDDVYILGTNAGDNYYSNLIQFLPRLFFNKKNNAKIAIHRNSSNKLRNFIKNVCMYQNIKISFLYLDDNFYSFKSSQFPQFFDLNTSINILNNLLLTKSNKFKDEKIYVTREDSAYRKIINESDLIPLLRSKGYKVINPNLYEIEEQINIFANAKKIISTHGSNLTNIIFCNEGTEIFEIGPKFQNNYELLLEDRYKSISRIKNLKYSRIITDTVNVKTHPSIAKKYINKKILDTSNYYKNLVVRISDFKNIE